MTAPYGDVEGALRDYLRSVAALSAIVDQRVFFSIPSDKNLEYPIVVVSLVGGGPMPIDASVTSALVQLDCWGPQGKNGKQTATNLMNVLFATLEQLQAGTALTDSATALGAHVTSAIWLPDPETGQARYALTVEVTVRTSSAE